MNASSPRHTDEQTDAALAFADRNWSDDSHTCVLAAKVRALRAELAAGAPQPDHWIDSVADDGGDARTPVWVFGSGVSLEGAESVTAWTDGIGADGDLSTGAAVDAIERDAHRLLAAVAFYRGLAGGAS